MSESVSAVWSVSLSVWWVTMGLCTLFVVWNRFYTRLRWIAMIVFIGSCWWQRPQRHLWRRAILSVNNAYTGIASAGYHTGGRTSYRRDDRDHQWQLVPVGVHPSASRRRAIRICGEHDAARHAYVRTERSGTIVRTDRRRRWCWWWFVSQRWK